MNLRKSHLRGIIKEELKNLLLEFDPVDDDKTQDIEGEPSETDAGHFDYDKGEDEVYEEDAAEDYYMSGAGSHQGVKDAEVKKHNRKKNVPQQEGHGSGHYRGPGDEENTGPSRGAARKRERELGAEKERETSAKDKRGAQRKRAGQAWKDQVAKNEGRKRISATKRKGASRRPQRQKGRRK